MPKIGVGIVTYNRFELVRKCYNSLPKELIDEIVIVSDGEPLPFDISKGVILQNDTNLGVGKSKNRALQYLKDKNCDYYFLIEDDIFIKNPEVFQKYIDTYLVTGIHHLNYSQHGMMNKSWPGGKPAPKLVIDCKKLSVVLYTHCVGACSFYTKECIDKVGLIDERYFNACEHVDHTYEIIKAGMHPPFWYFADIENSWEYLGDEEWSIEKSTISSRPNHKQMMSEADRVFVQKHGCVPTQIPLASVSEVASYFKNLIKNKTNE